MLPHGGYRNLLAFRKSEVVCQGTVVFCRRFLPAHGDRTVDQMVQAARAATRSADVPAALRDYLSAAGSFSDLVRRAAVLHRETDRISRDLARQRGWPL